MGNGLQLMQDLPIKSELIEAIADFIGKE